MNDALSILSTGLVTPVGLTAESSCAAFRAKLTNPVQTRFIDSRGEWLMAQEVPLARPWRGRAKLVRMAAMVTEEALCLLPRAQWPKIPILLCVAEADRPGRLEGLDDKLLGEVERTLGVHFAAPSITMPHGRVAVAMALSQARNLLRGGKVTRVLIVAVDTLLTWQTLSHYEREDRLLTPRNSDGFIPGEGAAALLVGLPSRAAHLSCEGIGFAHEEAGMASDKPLRADGLALAVREALADASMKMHDIDFRITDLSGEQYYFKEATLALSRNLHQRKEEMDLWHPAECMGEAGSVAGGAVIALADAACRKGFTKGNRILAHFGNDGGRRAALTLQYREAQ